MTSLYCCCDTSEHTCLYEIDKVCDELIEAGVEDGDEGVYETVLGELLVTGIEGRILVYMEHLEH